MYYNPTAPDAPLSISVSLRIVDQSKSSCTRADRSLKTQEEASALTSPLNPFAESIELYASLQPNAPALVARSAELTYRSLQASLNLVTAHLNQISCRCPIAVLGDASLEAHAVTISLHASSFSVVTLNLSWNASMIDAALRQAGCAAIVIAEQRISQLPELRTFANLELPLVGLDSMRLFLLEHQCHAPSFKYVVGSSGSMGEPKLIPITMRQFAIWWSANVPRFSGEPQRSIWWQSSPLSWDLSLYILAASLGNGDTAVVATPGDAHDGVARLAQFGITHWFSTPTAARFLLNSAGGSREAVPSLRHALFCGEPLEYSLVRQWNETISSDCRVTNVYGPSEATISAFSYDVPFSSEEARAGRVPIGYPVGEVDFDISSDHELILKGPQCFGGYLGRCEVLEPSSGRDYSTGDLVDFGDSVPPAGQGDPMPPLYFRSRGDRMVKVHGNRVDLSEIEVAFRECFPNHDGSASVTSGVGGFEMLRLTYVGSELSLRSIRSALAAHLPKYSLPSVLEFRKEATRTPTGKVDFRGPA